MFYFIYYIRAHPGGPPSPAQTVLELHVAQAKAGQGLAQLAKQRLKPTLATLGPLTQERQGKFWRFVAWGARPL